MVSTGVLAEVTVVATGEPATGETPLAKIEYVELLTLPEAAVTATVKETAWPVTPALTLPIFQLTTPAATAPPPVAETKGAPAGTVSLITIPAASPDPVLPYVSAYVRFWPETTEAGALLEIVSTGPPPEVVISPILPSPGAAADSADQSD